MSCVLQRQQQLQLQLQANKGQLSIAQVMPCLQHTASVVAIAPIVAPCTHTTLCCSIILNHSHPHHTQRHLRRSKVAATVSSIMLLLLITLVSLLVTLDYDTLAPFIGLSLPQ